jgi:hypothetical protein
MQSVWKNPICEIVYPLRMSGKSGEQEPMHPEDLKALRAWVTAKQFRELLLQKSANEKPKLYSAHFLG